MTSQSHSWHTLRMAPLLPTPLLPLKVNVRTLRVPTTSSPALNPVLAPARSFRSALRIPRLPLFSELAYFRCSVLICPHGSCQIPACWWEQFQRAPTPISSLPAWMPTHAGPNHSSPFDTRASFTLSATTVKQHCLRRQYSHSRVEKKRAENFAVSLAIAVGTAGRPSSYTPRTCKAIPDIPQCLRVRSALRRVPLALPLCISAPLHCVRCTSLAAGRIGLIKSWKTSAVSTTVWMIETQLCKLRGTSDTFV